MIAPEIRRAVLANLPAGISCLNDAVGLAAIDPAVPHVLVEGIDDLEDPIAFLSLVRERLPNARLFALVANAAHLPALAAFYAGRAPAAGHPLVREEIEPLLRAAGWQPSRIAPIVDAALPPTSPAEINGGAIIFQIVEPAMLACGRNAAFFVVAERR